MTINITNSPLLNMRFQHFYAVELLAALLLSTALCAEEMPQKARAIPIEWRNNLLDISADKLSLEDVMNSIADKTGLEIHGIEFLKGNVQADIKKQPLAAALKDLLQNVNYLLQEKSADNNHAVLTVLSLKSSSTNQTKSEPSPLGKTVKIPESAGYVPKEFHKLYAYAQKGDLQALKKTIQTGENAEQEIATKLLAQKNPDFASELAAENAKSSDPNRRLSAIQVLSELNNAQATETLGGALNDPDSNIRNAAVMGLHNQTSSNAIHYLTLALQDEDSSVRWLALDLLAEKGTEGVAGINEATASTDPQLREHAQALLKQIVAGESN